MKTIQFTFLIISLSVLGGFTSCEKTEKVTAVSTCDLGTNVNHPKADQYQKIIDDLLASGVPGVTVSVSSPEGDWTGVGGKADLKNNIDLTPCHPLRIGSITKIYTATTVLILQDEGVLNIKDKVNKYVPTSITDHIANANDVTIEQLLNHMAGIPNYTDLSTILGVLNLSIEKKSAEENLKLIYGKKSNYAPGEGGEYSNSHYLLLGLVIKHATGKKAYDVIREKIIIPLGLQNTYTSDYQLNQMSRSYYDIYDDGYMKDVTEIDNNAVGGDDMLDGGLIASSYDVMKFLKILLTGNILSEQSLAQMKNCLEIKADLGEMNFIKKYGLGLMQIEVAGQKGFGHYGNVYGFNGTTMYFPDKKVGVSIIINGFSHKIDNVINRKEIYNYLF